jgi:hypothetical protein
MDRAIARSRTRTSSVGYFDRKPALDVAPAQCHHEEESG